MRSAERQTGMGLGDAEGKAVRSQNSVAKTRIVQAGASDIF